MMANKVAIVTDTIGCIPKEQVEKYAIEQVPLGIVFGDKVYRTIVPRNVRLAEAPSHGLPALLYEKTSRGALAYLALAGEMLRRETRSKAAATAAAIV